MIRKLLIPIIVSLSIIACEKDKSSQISFTPTDFIIAKMDSQMRFTISIPTDDYYLFSADSSVLRAFGDKFHEYLVDENEMKNLAQNLSDTIIFQWKITTAVFPYPEDECKFRVDKPGFGDFMCSIGKGKTASNIITELSKSVSGDAMNAMVEIADYFAN